MKNLKYLMLLSLVISSQTMLAMSEDQELELLELEQEQEKEKQTQALALASAQAKPITTTTNIPKLKPITTPSAFMQLTNTTNINPLPPLIGRESVTAADLPQGPLATAQSKLYGELMAIADPLKELQTIANNIKANKYTGLALDNAKIRALFAAHFALKNNADAQQVITALNSANIFPQGVSIVDLNEWIKNKVTAIPLTADMLANKTPITVTIDEQPAQIPQGAQYALDAALSLPQVYAQAGQ